MILRLALPHLSSSYFFSNPLKLLLPCHFACSFHFLSFTVFSAVSSSPYALFSFVILFVVLFFSSISFLSCASHFLLFCHLVLAHLLLFCIFISWQRFLCCLFFLFLILVQICGFDFSLISHSLMQGHLSWTGQFQNICVRRRARALSRPIGVLSVNSALLLSTQQGYAALRFFQNLKDLFSLPASETRLFWANMACFLVSSLVNQKLPSFTS